MKYMNEQFENMVVLGTRTLSIYYSPADNLTSSIMEKVIDIEETYKSLTELDTGFSQRLKLKVDGIVLEDAINMYRLALNDFLNSPSPD